MQVRAAYASCVFLRTEVGGAITCQLVQARARVASIKPITIPRLELLACTIGSRLINTTKIDLDWRMYLFIAGRTL
ncbi:DUF5641 domain-containing protein [Trichonephila clavipes]|nr:DUF5641 domain-containing protein [Trichonephila clavipes]